mgnify:CR=1 FL=1
MKEVITVGLDIAKHVFQAHGISASGEVIFRRKLRRNDVLAFFEELPGCLIRIKACAMAHFWARQLISLGHQVKLIPAAYVKPYVKRQKNDAADAEAICQAVTRPTRRVVPVKTEEQQSVLMLHRVRELLIRQRTMLVNSLSRKAGISDATFYHWRKKYAGLIRDAAHATIGRRECQAETHCRGSVAG